MAHMVQQMAYVGATPWHGLGKPMAAGQPVNDKWRIESGFNWDAELRQVYYSKKINGRNVPTAIKGRFTLVRDDTQESLGVVSDRYKIVQPKEVLEFYRDLVADNGFEMETAGCLDGGRKIWALAKTGKNTRIMGQDQVGGYVLLATSYDGKMATIAKLTTVRVVCWNTLSASLNEDGQTQVSVGHNAVFNERNVKMQLGLIDGAWDNFVDNANILAQTKFTPAASLEFINRVIGDNAAKMDKKTGKVVASKQTEKLIHLAHNGKGQDYRAANGTYWGLVNAVTEYYDHHAKGKQDNRMNSAWFGRGDNIKQKAFSVALEMAA